VAPLTANFALKIKESVGQLDYDSKSKARLEGIIAGARYFVIPETLSIGADTVINTVGNFTDYYDKSYADIRVDLGFKVEYTAGAVKAGGISAKLLNLGQKIPDDVINFYSDSGEGYGAQFVLNPYIQYYLVEKVSLLKLSLTLTSNLSNYGFDPATRNVWKVTDKVSDLKVDLGYFHSLKGDVTDGLGDYSGFMAKYGVKFVFSDADLKPVNELTVGVRWAF